MAIQSNESNFKEEDIIGLFDDGNPSEYDLAIANLIERNNTLKEEVTNLKREHEIQAIRLCEETEIRKKAIEEKVMIEDDTRLLRNILDEKISYVKNLTKTQL